MILESKNILNFIPMLNLTKMKFIFLILCATLIGCTNNDDDEIVLKNVKGTIIGTVSCDTESNGPAYEIQIENFDAIEKIIVSNLPIEFKQDGTKINFDMEKSIEDFGACVSLYSPDVFYKLKNITIISN